MDTLKLITDHKWKQFTYRCDVPVKVLADQFDYQDPDECTDYFFKYRGYWYHIDEFMVFENDPDHGFHGHAGQSFFETLLIKLSNDGEEYQIARQLS